MLQPDSEVKKQSESLVIKESGESLPVSKTVCSGKSPYKENQNNQACSLVETDSSTDENAKVSDWAGQQVPGRHLDKASKEGHQEFKNDLLRPKEPSLDQDRYKVLDFIGSGANGSVWKVQDTVLNQVLAIKVMNNEQGSDETSIKRFQNEAKLASTLTHANIGAIFGPGIDLAGCPFVIMKYIDGESLASIIEREKKLDPVRAEDIFRQIEEALSHAHMKGIIHRDVKPSNIIISKTELGADLVHLVDFGLAKSFYGELSRSQAITGTTEIVGSPLYMSPEQFLGEDVGPYSDYYSLGCVFYEMLTGKPPFEDKNIARLILEHIGKSPDLTDVPPKYRAIISAYFEKQASDRKFKIKQFRESPVSRLLYSNRVSNALLLNVLVWTPQMFISMALESGHVLQGYDTIAAIPLTLVAAQFVFIMLHRSKINSKSETFMDVQFAICLSLLLTLGSVLIAYNLTNAKELLIHWRTPFQLISLLLIYTGFSARLLEKWLASLKLQ